MRALLARCFALCAGFCCAAVAAQDFYDPAVLRTIQIRFTQPNWETLLRDNYASETDLFGTVEVDGVVYPGVGIRIRGNTSYTGLPAGSRKFSLKLEMDLVDPQQDLLGYQTINLNNGWRDPTFSREVEFNNLVAQFVPNARANNVVVTINGENWGVYNNVQQSNKRMLRDYFENADGLRIRCPNQPNGPGLSYAGTNPANYALYEVQDAGGLPDPVGTLINLTNTLSNAPLGDVAAIDAQFAIDPSIWTVVLENLLTDDDSYVNKGCDFMTYRDPLDSRTHLIQRDANETWTQQAWSVTRNFGLVNRPVLSRVLSVPELRQRYMAHYRTAKQRLDWSGELQARFAARKALLQAAVAADTKRIYTLANFNDNYANAVTLTNNLTNLPATGIAGGTLVGLQQFVEGRAAFVNSASQNAELNTPGPTIGAVEASNSTPAPTTPVFITAAVQANGGAVAMVELFHRPDRTGVYQRASMLDDGNSGDGAAGDGVYGVRLPVIATPGLRVPYYVMARAANAFNTLGFSPALAERGPRWIDYALGGSQPIQITEWMYSGIQGEFVELTNRGGTPVDLGNWVLKDDNLALPGLPLTALGTIQPGESVVITEADADAFRAAWSLAPTTRVIGLLGSVGVGGSNYGRNDQIHVFDAGGVLVDRLFYGDQTYPGTIRTQNASGQAPCSALGQNTIAAWVLSAVGDAYGSLASAPTATGLRDIGSPGTFASAACAAGEVLFADGFE
jgi:hypothetical protein